MSFMIFESRHSEKRTPRKKDSADPAGTGESLVQRAFFGDGSERFDRLEGSRTVGLAMQGNGKDRLNRFAREKIADRRLLVSSARKTDRPPEPE